MLLFIIMMLPIKPLHQCHQPRAHLERKEEGALADEL
jgi:hypothetical protein